MKTIKIPLTITDVKEKKRILIATVPADGHFNPLTGIAKFLYKNGYDVAWYTSDLYRPKLHKLGIQHFSFKKALDVNGTNIEQVFPERDKISNPVKKLNFDFINFFMLRGEEYYEDILEIRKEFPFDVVIADIAFSGIPFITDKMNIPVISIGIFPLTETSKDLAPSGLGMTPSYSIVGRIKQGFLRFFADRILFKEANNKMREVLKKNNISHDSNNVFDLLAKKSTLVLQSGTPGFEYYRSDLGKNVRFIGPLLPAVASNKEQWFDQRLNQYNKIVLVTQGTVEKDINKLLIPTLEAFKNTDTLVVATTGGSKTQELKSLYPQNNFIIEDFIPFNDIMPYADVYITNGGYGGVMLAIENKLPMVVAGVHEGKNEINARIGYFNLGIDLKTETPKPENILSAVEEIISTKTYKENIIRLGEEFSNYDTESLMLSYIDQVIQTKSGVLN